MRLLIVCGAVALALIAESGAQAQAREYPWCAFYGGIGGSGIGSSTYNCGFVSFQQCLATISGVGGSCRPNPRYVGEPVRRQKRPRY
jgi:hypothetical protein